MTATASPISLYRQERRAQEIPGMRREDLGTVVRYTPTSPNAEGLVCFARLAETDLHAEIERHIAHFRTANVEFEWKVYDSDEPASLRDRLRSAGFEEGEPESLMVYETRKFIAASAPPADVQIVRMRDAVERGVEWVAVEAAPMSRPILEAKGFREIDRTYPMRWAPVIS